MRDEMSEKHSLAEAQACLLVSGRQDAEQTKGRSRGVKKRGYLSFRLPVPAPVCVRRGRQEADQE